MKQLYKNISFTGLHQIFVTALAFVLVPVATRYLGVDDYGLYAVATTIGFFVNLIADLGLSTILTREIAKHPKIVSKLFAHVLSLKLVLTIAAVCILIICLLIAHYSPKSTRVILVFSIAALLGSFSSAAFGVFRGVEKMQYEAIGVSLDKFLSVSIGIAVLLLGFGVEYFIWSFVISGLVLFVFSFRILYKKFLTFELNWRRRGSLIVLRISIYLGISAFLAMAYNYLDILMLSKMGTLQDIGLYSAAYRILMVTRIFPTILVTAFLPQLSSNHTNVGILSAFFREGVSYLLLIIIPLIPAAVYLAKPIMLFICGQDFVAGAAALQILAFAIAAQTLNIFFVPLYVATNNQNKIVHFQVFGLLVNVALNLLLIPLWSFIGAAIATVATEGVIFLFIYLWIRRKLGVPLFPQLFYSFKVTFNTAVMMAVVFFARAVHLHILVVIILAILCYFLALEFTNTFRLSYFTRMMHAQST